MTKRASDLRKSLSSLILGTLLAGAQVAQAQEAPATQIFLPLLSPQPPARADRLDLAGGRMLALAAQGSRVYLGVGRQLHVLDAAPGESTRALGSIVLPLPSDASVMPQPIREITTGPGGLRVLAGAQAWQIDVSRPQQPVIQGQTPAPHASERHRMGTIFVAVGYGRDLISFDMQDPARPHEIGRFEGAIESSLMKSTLLLHGGHAYLGTGHGLASFAVHPDRGPERLWRSAAGPPVNVVLAENERLYVSDHSVPHQASWPPALRILDIRDPANPRPLGQTAAGCDAPIQHAARYGRYLLAACGNDELLVIDDSDPRAPFEVTRLPVALDWQLRAVPSATSDRAFHLVTKQGLASFDLHNPKHPRPLGTFLPFHGADEVAAIGEQIVILDREMDRLWSLEWPQPGRLTVRDHRALDERISQLLGTPEALYAVGNAARGQSHASFVLGFARRAPLRETSRLLLPWSIRAAATDDGLLVTAGAEGLNVMSRSGQGTGLTEIARLPHLDPHYNYVAGLDLRRGWAWLAFLESRRLHMRESLQAVDLSDPWRPRWGARLALPDDTRCLLEDVVLGQNHAFVATRCEIYSVDIRDPEQPRIVGRQAVPSGIYHLLLHDDTLYTTSVGETWAFDVSQPSNLQTRIRLPREYVALAHAGAKALAVDWDRQLHWLELGRAR